MKTIEYTEYGPPAVLEICEREVPEPGPDEIRVRVHASSVGFGDVFARDFGHVSPREFPMALPIWFLARLMFGFRRPKKRVLGSEFSGVVDEIGHRVERLGPGDEVFGYRGPALGAYAESICVPAKSCVARKPARVGHSEAAVVPCGAVTALQLLASVKVRKEPLSSGHRVLVLGASGAIGSAAVQIAVRHYGCRVTGVCSTSGVEFVRSIGASEVIDYTREDVADGGAEFDLILDVRGKSTFSKLRHRLTPDGVHLFASFKLREIGQMVWTSLFGRQKVRCTLAAERPEAMEEVARMVESGVLTPVIDRRFPFEEVRAAHEYFEAHSRRGGIALEVSSGE